MLKHLLRGLATIALALSAIGTANAADKIVIGMASGINQLPSLVAHAKGFFKEQGLDVENKPVARGAVALGAVASGSLQFAESAHVPFMAAVSKGIPLVSVGIATRGFFGKMVASPKNAGLKTLADFKGKRIGIQVGTGVHTVILMLLEKQGLKPDDFQFTNLRVVDMPAAMAAPNNTFDAVIGWEPGMTRIAQAGHGKIVIEANQFEQMAGITYPFLVSTTREYLKANPVVVQKVINAYAKADKYIREHNDDAVKIYTDEVKRRGGKLTEDIIRVMLFDTARFGGPALADADMKDLAGTRDFLIKIGKLKSLPPFEEFIDRGFGQKAEQALTH
jgi:ABC-type nitrate/sulfonate/bicarbonate transport system substrate-binding protein